MKLDTRNPFAAWGFEQEVYAVNVAEGDDSGIVKLEEKGFINETVVDEDYNQVAQPITAQEYSENHTEQASFFTNNENMLPTSLATKAYGDNQELQREYPAGESLNYYGNEADDLKLYGDATTNEENNTEATPEPVTPTEPEVPVTPETPQNTNE